MVIPLNPSSQSLSSIASSEDIQDELSLEDEFGEMAYDQSLRATEGRSHYLVPNEWPIQNVRPHLLSSEKGIHLCVGTERLFMNAVLAPKRDGIMGIDIDPLVKMYNDFNTLLLLISEDCTEYYEWASHPQALPLIKEKLHKTLPPSKRKEYYLKNLETFATLFYPAKQQFFQLAEERPDQFVSYHSNQENFLKLHQYAKSGNLLTLCRDINDLQFLDSNRIAEIDTSNVFDYRMLDFQSQKVRVIWTVLGSEIPTTYYSWNHIPLSPKEREEIDKNIAHIQRTHEEGEWHNYVTHSEVWSPLRVREVNQRNPYQASPIHSYSQQTLQRLRESVQSLNQQ